MFRELYKYRELLKTNVKKEIRGKYKGSFLGVLWSFVNPLLTTLVYAIIFPFILKSGRDHYTTFIVIAILPWTFFTTSISQTNCILIQGQILKKVYFPRIILPLSVVLSTLVNFLISCLIIFIFLFFSGIGFNINILYLPLIIITQFILTFGLLLITCSIDVYVRDLEYIVNFFMAMLFYATPVLYSMDMFPERIQRILHINPMATIIESYRDIFYFQTAPNFYRLAIVFACSVLVLLIGIKVFNKLEKGFAEEV